MVGTTKRVGLPRSLRSLAMTRNNNYCVYIRYDLGVFCAQIEISSLTY
jgi:hypothetical protein